MPMQASVMEAILTGMTATDDATTHQALFAFAYSTMCATAMYGPNPVTPVIMGGLNDLKAELAGWDEAGTAAQKIQDGIKAFWDTVDSNKLAIFPPILPGVPVPPNIPVPPPTLIKPPGLSGIKSALEEAFQANTEGKKSLADSVKEVARVCHEKSQNGKVLWKTNLPPPAGTPVPPVPLPIS